MRIFKHLVRFADTRRGSDVNAQSWLLAFFYSRE
jgi:hypothetical protein